MSGRLRRARFASLLGAIALAAAAFSGCAASGASSSSAPASSAGIATSLATSIETSAGTWAVVPMGHLDQPLNTFWQLFFRAKGATRWSDYASALAVATNGGLLVATPNGRSLVVGIRPANLLDYSPILITANNGRTWIPASPVSALAEHTDSLSVQPGGRALALTNEGSATRVFASPRELSSDWHELTTASQLASSPAGRSCALVSITAVGYASGQPVVASSCRHHGTVGIYTKAQGEWQLVGPTLPASLESGSVDVLGLPRTSSGLCALLAVATPHGTSLVVAWTEGLHMPWQISKVFGLARSDHALSFGGDGPTGLFVLTSASTAAKTLLVLTGPGAAWNELPAPPPDTSTVAFGTAGSVDALAVDDTSFTDWRLVRGSSRWSKVQALSVAIQFGSSS